jgi:hypothetical protein
MTPSSLTGCDRLDDVLYETASRGADMVKSAVLTRLEDFLGGRKPKDGVTLLIVERSS